MTDEPMNPDTTPDAPRYTFTAAIYVNADRTAAVAQTAESGAVALSAADTPAQWAELLAAMTPEDFVEPPAPIPQTVTRFQAKAALSIAGKLAAAQTLVDAATDPIVALAWNEAAVFERQSPMLLAMAPSLWPEDTDAHLDAMFIAAAGISA